MRIYNVLGYAALGLQLVLSAWLAPPSLGPWWSMAIGLGYLVMSRFLAGVYLSDVMHMGITHAALEYKEWFIKGVTLVNNTVGCTSIRSAGSIVTGCTIALRITTAIRTSSMATASGERCTAVCFPTGPAVANRAATAANPSLIGCSSLAHHHDFEVTRAALERLPRRRTEVRAG